MNRTNTMARRVSPIPMIVAAAGFALAAPANAAPQVGAPCARPAEIQLVQRGGPYLICGVGTAPGSPPPAWQTYNDPNVIAAGVKGNIGDPCTPTPDGPVAFAFDHTPGRDGMYLAICHGNWVPFRP
ncbi:hypothetical protein [Mycobacterium marseillense]|uniref:hypothetical protein n=1 Tax=Mycobacterium marseillense TaxID=701042 RepID=UPI0010424A1B|nr:hypothetical protein [Mycobacterium marseillense]